MLFCYPLTVFCESKNYFQNKNEWVNNVMSAKLD